MKIVKFEDLIVWQRGQDIAESIYSTFQNSKEYDFKNQIFRASVSISNNIAEGFDRNSRKEFVRFLYIALASNSEVKSMLYLAIRLRLVEEIKLTELIEKSIEISKLLNGLIKSIQKNTDARLLTSDN